MMHRDQSSGNHFPGNSSYSADAVFEYSGFNKDLGMDERTEAERLAQARLEIAKRIKGVCEVFLPADCERLLDQMARIQCKYGVFPGPADLGVNRDPAPLAPHC